MYMDRAITGKVEVEVMEKPVIAEVADVYFFYV